MAISTTMATLYPTTSIQEVHICEANSETKGKKQVDFYNA
jgi:hypothetical protein